MYQHWNNIPIDYFVVRFGEFPLDNTTWVQRTTKQMEWAQWSSCNCLNSYVHIRGVSIYVNLSLDWGISLKKCYLNATLVSLVKRSSISTAKFMNFTRITVLFHFHKYEQRHFAASSMFNVYADWLFANFIPSVFPWNINNLIWFCKLYFLRFYIDHFCESQNQIRSW